MQQIGRFLQISGLIIVPLGLVHFFSMRNVMTEASLMAWELGLLTLGAVLFIVGKKLMRES